MQALTLDVILGVVLGAPDARLREAIRGALDLAQSLARLMVSRSSRRARRLAPLRPCGERVDALLLEAIRSRPRDGEAVIDELIAAGGTERELRDQVVTLLAAGHETTAGSLAWACERLARHPEVQERLREDGDAYLDATVKEVLRTRPVLSITPRKAAVPYELGGSRCRRARTSRPASTSRTAAPSCGPTRPRSGRSASSAAQPAGLAPFGGGIRRCAGAAFATMELHEVLRAVVHAAGSRPTGRRASGCAAAA